MTGATEDGEAAGTVDEPMQPGSEGGIDRVVSLEARVERLERANRELRRTNAELARAASARRDAGAASALARATEAERTLLRSQGWDEWPKPLRWAVSLALKLRRLGDRLSRGR